MPWWPRLDLVSVTSAVRYGWRSPIPCFIPPLCIFIIVSFQFFAPSIYPFSLCVFQTSSPAPCGPSSSMYRTLSYAVWLTSYPKLPLAPERIILHSPISTVLNDGALGPPSFPRLLCYQLHLPMLPCTCLVFFSRPVLHPLSSQPCTVSVGRMISLVWSLQLVILSHKRS